MSEPSSTSLDPTVAGFFTKNAADDYATMYDLDHGPRLDAMIARYRLGDLKNVSVADVGGGLGFLGKRLDASNDYWVYDGSDSTPETRVSKGTWVKVDLDRDQFWPDYEPTDQQFDTTFCLETLEHLSNPYHCLCQIKAITKPNGTVILSIPTETVWHNTIYPGLLWPPQNFAVFLSQMALPIEDFWTYEPKVRGWPAYHFRCRNAPWSESRMLFPKSEAKFQGKTPIEYVNL